MSEDSDEIQQAPSIGDRVLQRLGQRIADLEIQLSMTEAQGSMRDDELERLRQENAEQTEELERLRNQPEPTAPPIDKAPAQTQGKSKAKQSA